MNKTKTKTEEQKEAELIKLKNWLMKMLPDGYDKYDLRAKYDSTLTYVENKEEIREDIKLLLNDKNLDSATAKAELEAAKAEEQRQIEEKKKQAEEEAVNWNKQLEFEDNTEADKFYEPISIGVDKICKGFSNLLFVKGRGGLGKSYNIRKQLVKNKTDFVEVAGEVTEAYLYRLMFENNNKIIWFKDVVKLLTGLKSMNLLKSATETDENRLITKSNYSKSQDDLPDKFMCKCKFIFDYNNVYNKGLRDDFEALVSRGDFVELSFCDKDIKTIMKAISKDDDERMVTDYLIETFEANGLFRLNLRNQWKAFNTFKYSNDVKGDWKKLLSDELKNASKTRSLIYSLIGDGVVKTTDLKKKLLKHELLNSIRTAERRIRDWLFLEELFLWSDDERNPLISINERPKLGGK